MPDDPVAACFEESLPRLIKRSLVDDFASEVVRYRLPAGKIQLLIYAPVPESLELPVSTEIRRDGRILFVREMSLQVSAPVNATE